MAKDFTNDSVLLEELKKHNGDAYRYFYVHSRMRLFVLSFSIVKDEDAAKDVLQDFYTDFWDGRLYEKIIYSLQAYVYTAVKYRSIVYKKKIQKYTAFIDSISASPVIDTPRYFEREEENKMIESAIGKLPPMAGKVFRMHYLERHSHAQIAELLGIRRATVANHIHRALTELRVELKKKLYSD